MPVWICKYFFTSHFLVHLNKILKRCEQDSNLRRETPTDHKSIALTARPSQLLICWVKTCILKLKFLNEHQKITTLKLVRIRMRGWLFRTRQRKMAEPCLHWRTSNFAQRNGEVHLFPATSLILSTALWLLTLTVILSSRNSGDSCFSSIDEIMVSHRIGQTELQMMWSCCDNQEVHMWQTHS